MVPLPVTKEESGGTARTQQRENRDPEPLRVTAGQPRVHVRVKPCSVSPPRISFIVEKKISEGAM